MNFSPILQSIIESRRHLIPPSVYELVVHQSFADLLEEIRGNFELSAAEMEILTAEVVSVLIGISRPATFRETIAQRIPLTPEALDDLVGGIETLLFDSVALEYRQMASGRQPQNTEQQTPPVPQPQPVRREIASHPPSQVPPEEREERRVEAAPRRAPPEPRPEQRPPQRPVPQTPPQRPTPPPQSEPRPYTPPPAPVTSKIETVPQQQPPKPPSEQTQTPLPPPPNAPHTEPPPLRKNSIDPYREPL